MLSLAQENEWRVLVSVERDRRPRILADAHQTRIDRVALMSLSVREPRAPSTCRAPKHMAVDRSYAMSPHYYVLSEGVKTQAVDSHY